MGTRIEHDPYKVGLEFGMAKAEVRMRGILAGEGLAVWVGKGLRGYFSVWLEKYLTTIYRRNYVDRSCGLDGVGIQR